MGMALRNVANNGTNWYLATDQGVFASTKNAGQCRADVYGFL